MNKLLPTAKKAVSLLAPLPFMLSAAAGGSGPLGDPQSDAATAVVVEANYSAIERPAVEQRRTTHQLRWSA